MKTSGTHGKLSSKATVLRVHMVRFFRTGLLAAAFSLCVSSAVAQGWVYEEEKNPLTGKTDSWAGIRAPEPSVGSNFGKKHMTIFVACIEGNFEISVDTEEYLGRGRIDVRYRADEGSVTREKWIASTDGTGVFVPQTYKDFRRLLTTSAVIAFEASDYRGVTYRTVFSNLNLKTDAIDRVLNNCASK